VQFIFDLQGIQENGDLVLSKMKGENLGSLTIGKLLDEKYSARYLVEMKEVYSQLISVMRLFSGFFFFSFFFLDIR
jgi:hypothetical protein